jgi:putative transposase
LEYLARHVFRVAIANSRILSCQDGVVNTVALLRPPAGSNTSSELKK